MKRILIIILFFSSTAAAQNLRLPPGVTMDTIPELAQGLYRHHLKMHNQVIGMIVPKTWHNNDTRGIAIATMYEVTFLMGQTQTENFATVKRSLEWLIPVIENYLSPVGIQKWQRLKTQPPKVSLKYPWEWDYKLSRYNSIFMSKAQTDNKLVLRSAAKSEIVQIIRTPNTGNLTREQVIQMTMQINRAINLQQHPLTDITIGEKIFKTTEHFFMEQMKQQHFWYADANEIIYISVGLLREEQVRYPLIIKEILESIKW
jgi:hypothetical protein